MALDNGQYIKELNDALPLNQDPRNEGAGQIRAVKTALKNSFPNVDKQVGASADRMNAIFNTPVENPIGGIIMWEDPFNLPSGWALCDGGTYNGVPTPDLRNKFIKGWGTQGAGSTGGNNAPDLTQHLQVENHKLTINEIPQHDHIGGWGESNAHAPGSQYPYGGIIIPGLWRGSHSTDADNNEMPYTSKTGGSASHPHNLLNKAGQPFDNQPEYYVLVFIKYVGVAI